MVIEILEKEMEMAIKIMVILILALILLEKTLAEITKTLEN